MINNDIKINTERDSKFEILRIVAIVMIIYHHFIVHAPGVNPMELYNSGDITFFNLIITELMASFGKVGVFIFGLLTGYFMIDKNCIRFSRVIKLILLTLFYSIIIYSLSIYFDFVEFSIKNLLHICLPLTFNLY